MAKKSSGTFNGIPVLDLDYAEDSNAETDMNVVMNNENGFIEVQGKPRVTLKAKTNLTVCLHSLKKD